MQRYLIPASFGAAVTFALLFVMQALISTVETPLEPPIPPFDINWVRLVYDTESEPIVRVPEPPSTEQPPEMPRIQPVVGPRPDHAVETIGIGPVGPPEITPETGRGFASDSDAVPAIRVNPSYPAQARMHGIEGWVEVEFAITAAGTVTKARVIRSSHGVFERSALRAIRKWRYNPRVVEGRAVRRDGVRVRLLFELDEV
jgi:protein TonB